MTSAFDRRAEIERLLETDTTVLGRLWKYEQDGLSPRQMTELEGVADTTWVPRYRSLLRVLRDGEIPSSPSAAQAAAQRVRAWLRKRDLSLELRRELTDQEAKLTAVAEDQKAKDAEIGEAVGRTAAAEAVGTPGIYVYTLPHYLRYPYDPATNRTLLKVGHSSVDAYYRASSQGRLTALPEDPVLLRIYPVAESDNAEKLFHGWLRAADHAAARTRRGGSEWYLTSTKFLDHIAQSLDLEVRIVAELDADEE